MTTEEIKLKCIEFAKEIWPITFEGENIFVLSKELYKWVTRAEQVVTTMQTECGEEFTTSVDTESGGLVLSNIKIDK